MTADKWQRIKCDKWQETSDEEGQMSCDEIEMSGGSDEMQQVAKGYNAFVKKGWKRVTNNKKKVTKGEGDA